MSKLEKESVAQPMDRWGWWTCHVAEALVRRWYSQGGVEPTHFTPSMLKRLEYLLNSMGDEISSIHTKAFSVLNKAPRE